MKMLPKCKQWRGGKTWNVECNYNNQNLFLSAKDLKSSDIIILCTKRSSLLDKPDRCCQLVHVSHLIGRFCVCIIAGNLSSTTTAQKSNNASTGPVKPAPPKVRIVIFVKFWTLLQHWKLQAWVWVPFNIHSIVLCSYVKIVWFVIFMFSTPNIILYAILFFNAGKERERTSPSMVCQCGWAVCSFKVRLNILYARTSLY